MVSLNRSQIEEAARDLYTNEVSNGDTWSVCAFISGAEFAQKAILEKCASGLNEWFNTYHPECDPRLIYNESREAWQASRLSAEKEIADLREKIYQCGLVCECTTYCDCYIKKFNNLEKEIAELKKRLDGAELMAKTSVKRNLAQAEKNVEAVSVLEKIKSCTGTSTLAWKLADEYLSKKGLV